MRFGFSELLHPALDEPVDMSMHDIFRQALHARGMLEHVWDDQTAFQGVLPLKPEDVVSRGQCGVSSIWFARYLHGLGCQALIVEGKIILGNGEKDDHVWVQAEPTGLKLDVDITSDQYRTLFGTKVHVGQTGKGESGDPVQYAPEMSFDPFDVPRKKLMGRYALLENKVNKLPFWRTRYLIKPLPGKM
jgi:hypothetical protein